MAGDHRSEKTYGRRGDPTPGSCCFGMRYAMKWRPGLVFIHWEVELRPPAGEHPRAEPEFIDSGWSLTLDGAIQRAARVMRRERAATHPPGRTIAETEVLHRADAIARSNAIL